MERVPDRNTYVALLVGDLDLYMEAASTRQIPNRRACDGHKWTTANRGNCPATAGGGERIAHHYYGRRVSLTATAETACVSPSSPITPLHATVVETP